MRSRRLFEKIDSIGKNLERLLIDISKKLFGKDALPILPAAFLELVHPHPRLRIPLSQRRAMKSATNKTVIRYPHKEINMLKEYYQDVKDYRNNALNSLNL